MNRTATISSPAMPSLLGVPAFEFKSLKGGESLGNLFSYVILLQTPDSPALTEVVTANLPIKDLVGKDFSVKIELDGKGFMAGEGAGIREINGLVTQARYVHSEDRRSIYEVIIEPWLTLATRTSDYKIFQNKTALEIIQEVLSDYSYPVDVRLSHRYPVRVFQVQYGETDFAFISRIMEEWGIYYFFEHKDDKHTLVLVDDAGAHKPHESLAYQSINFYGESAKIDEEYCDFFDVADTLVSGKWVTNDFDFKKPKASLEKAANMPRQTGNAAQEMYRWPGDYVVPDEGELLARVRMEGTGSSGKRARGAGNLRAMTPGCTFTLNNHPQDSSNRDWLILGADLEIHESGHASGEGDYWCRTEFYVQPANDTYRSAQRHGKPRTTGPQTAIVTGKAGQEIWTNEYGQVKVSFHWNRYCSKDENSSCWIRVSYPWAGNGFGSIAIPRIGQEVIVDFENGDPDRPIITGRVYNALNMPPWELPGNATQSGVLTRSSLGGACGAGMKSGTGDANALRFEDKKDQEQLWLHAQKDQLTEVENDEDKWVGNDRRKTIDGNETNLIHKNRTETVDQDETITIHQNRNERVDLDESVDIGQNRSKTIGQNESDSIGKNWSVSVGQNWSTNVGMFKIENIGMAYMQNVGLGKMVNIGAGYNTNVGLGRIDTVVLSWTQTVGKSLSVTAGDVIELCCGKSVLRMDKNGKVTIKGTEFLFDASGPVQINGKDIDLN